MLLKLLKYDFRAMWKQFSLVWGAALVLALCNRFTWSGQDSTSLVGEHTTAFLTMSLFAVIVAMFVICAIFVIQRFGKGLLGDEGYLMHTLPVRPWQLVASKLVCAVVTCVGSTAVAFLTPFLMSPLNWLELLDLHLWWDILRAVHRHPDVLGILLELCLLMLSALVMTISVMYLAMAVGHLFSRHRRLAGVAAFIGLYVLLSSIYSRFLSLHIVQQLMGMAEGNIHGSMLIAIAMMLIPALGFLAMTSWILEHKLNLE